VIEKDEYPKELLDFNGIRMSYAFITQLVNTANCINFPCEGDDFSFVSIKLTAYQQRMESTFQYVP
jgi:hypothetical protein